MSYIKLKNYFKNLIKILIRTDDKKSVFTNFIFAEITLNKKITFFKKNRLYGKINIDEGVSMYNTQISGDVSIGRFTSINGPNTTIISKGNKVIIGAFSSIARNVQIQGHNHNYQRTTSSSILKTIFKIDDTSDYESKGDIIIGEDVWIGTNSVILSGVKIGRGSIIAAGLIVTKDIAPYSIVGGVPAKLIKKRFSETTINELESSKWWEWERNEILKHREFFKLVRN